MLRLNRSIQLAYYPPIIGQAQTDYMLHHLYTLARMRADMETRGEQFFLLDLDQKPAGYFSFYNVAEKESIKLSRVFIDESARGKGLFRYAFDYMVDMGRKSGMKFMFLTVNKNNKSAINVYEKTGFEKIEEARFDIGGGFVMDDFVFQLKL